MNEFEFEIKPGERLPPETKMDLPEMSYFQELLNTPVPLEKRIISLPLGDPVEDKHTIRSIADELGASYRHVKEIVNDVGIVEDEASMLPLYSLEIVREELVWDAIIDLQPDRLSARSIGNVLGRDREWVIRSAYELAIYPHATRSSNYMTYDKSLIGALRIVMLHTPLAGEWQTVDELSSDVGRNSSWVAAILRQTGIEPQTRISKVTNRMIPHYPPESKDVLGANNIFEMAGNWLTIFGMAERIHRGYLWVKGKIESEEITGEPRRDDTNRVGIHYSPEVFERIQLLDELERKERAPDGYISERELARRLGRSWKWVRARKDAIDADVLSYEDSLGRTIVLYPEVSQAQMQDLPSRQPKRPAL